MEEVIGEINEIIKRLQSDKWSNHSEELLLSSQGKLATYLSNLSSMVAEAGQAFETLDLNADQYENEQYLVYKDLKRTENESKARAKMSCSEKRKTVIDAKHRYYELRGIHNSCESLITAIQVQLRFIHREESTSKFQGQ